MNNKLFLLILISPFISSCNMAFLSHRDYKINSNDLTWSRKIENQVGEIYLEKSNIILGRNWDSTFIVISPETGDILDTLTPFKVPQEREGYGLYNIPVDKNKYLKITLNTVERQYRGDNETYYLIVKTITGKEFTLLFNRRKFTSISDIIYLKDGKFVIKYNCAAGATMNDPYIIYMGLFDLDKIINKE